MLPIMVIGALIFSIVADYTTPLNPGDNHGCFSRFRFARFRFARFRSVISPVSQRQHPNLGNRVRYLGENGWMILNVAHFLSSQLLCFCQVADGNRDTQLAPG
jgi:hypothetical protein